MYCCMPLERVATPFPLVKLCVLLHAIGTDRHTFSPGHTLCAGHWNGPLGAFFESFGAVKASPMAAFRLLKNNEKVLLHGGGGAVLHVPLHRGIPLYVMQGICVCAHFVYRMPQVASYKS